MRKTRIAGLIFCLVMSLTALSEPYSGQLYQVQIGGGGRFLVGTFTGSYVAVWDLDRLEEPLKAAQVAGFAGTAYYRGNWMSTAMSLEGRSLAWHAGADREDPSQVQVCSVAPRFDCRNVFPLGPDGDVAGISPDGTQLALIEKNSFKLVSTAGRRVRSTTISEGLRFLNADWTHGFVFFDSEKNTIEWIHPQTLRHVRQALPGANLFCEAAHFSTDGILYVSCQVPLKPEAKIVWRLAGAGKIAVVPDVSLVVESELPGHLYEVRRLSPGVFRISPLGQGGRSGNLELNIGDDAHIVLVLEKRGLVVVEKAEALVLYDQRRGIPVAGLDSEALRYVSDGETPAVLANSTDAVTAWMDSTRRMRGRERNPAAARSDDVEDPLVPYGEEAGAGTLPHLRLHIGRTDVSPTADVSPKAEVLQALSLVYQKRWDQADLLLSRLLLEHPADWRAHEALILRHLGSSEEVFLGAVERAQKALSPGIWIFGTETEFGFFDERALAALRRAFLLAK